MTLTVAVNFVACERRDNPVLLLHASVDINDQGRSVSPRTHCLLRETLMQWTYDAAVDALTILLLPGRRSARTDEWVMGMFCDYDRMGHPVSIEILDASTHFPARTLRALPLPEVMVPLSEASRAAGLDPSTLRQQIRNKRLRDKAPSGMVGEGRRPRAISRKQGPAGSPERQER